MHKHQNIYAHLQAQQQVLNEKTLHLQQVNNTLQTILEHLSPSEIPRWNDLVNLIERYHMTDNLRENLKKTWAGQLTEKQFEEYLFFYEKFPKEFSEREKIIKQINNNELGDPTGSDEERVALNELIKVDGIKESAILFLGVGHGTNQATPELMLKLIG